MSTWFDRVKPLRELFKGSARFFKPQLDDIVLTFFLWFSLVILSGLGSADRLTLSGLSSFVGIGLLGLILAAGIALLLNWRKTELSLVVFFIYVLLVMLPAVFVAPQSSSRIILLDLYFVLLVTTPAFLNLWSWRFQGLAGLLAFSAVSIMWLPVGFWAAAHSMIMVGLAALLSGLVVLLRSRDAVQETRQLERKGLRLYFETARRRSQDYVWNILLLQAGLLIVLIFFDLTVWGESSYSLLLPKVYGLVVLVFGGLLLKASRSAITKHVSALVTVLVGFVLSISRVSYPDHELVIAALPILYLTFLVSGLSWRLEKQIFVIWALLVSDLTIKYVHFCLNNSVGAVESFGQMLQHYRGELAVLSLGSVIAVAVARSLRQYRVRNVSHFVEIRSSNRKRQDGRSVSEKSEESWEEISCSAQVAIEPERCQQLIVGLFIAGMVSSIVSSRLILSLGVAFWNLAFAGWAGFFVVWAGLVYLEREPGKKAYVWGLGILAEIALFLWPCILILVSPASGYLWLYWPIGVVLGIGFVPWHTKELILLLFVTVSVGIEIIHQLHLDLAGVILFSISVIAAVLISIQGSRRIKEKQFLFIFSEQLKSCRSEGEVLRLLSDYLMNLFGVISALLSTSPEHLELMRPGKIFALSSQDWPLRNLRSRIRNLSDASNGVFLSAANWLPAASSFFDKRFGMFQATNGLLVEIQLAADDQNYDPSDSAGSTQSLDTREEPYVVFLGLRFPLFKIFRTNELNVAVALSGIAKLKLEYFAKQHSYANAEKRYEARLQEREHDLGALVHDINNTVQDLTLLCDTILEDILGGDESEGEAVGEKRDKELHYQVKRISVIARSVATVVSDAKRRRELEKMADLTPRENVEVNEVIREIVSFAVIRAARKRIFVEQPKLPSEELWVRVSVQEHLETILRNLLNNAVAYSDPGATIRIELRYDHDWVWIDVIDNGPGLNKDERQAIFSAGYRGRSASGIPGGLGMGLAESRRVAEAAGGRLEAFSAGEGQGSTFTVCLPRAAEPEKLRQLEAWALVVDDQPALADFYGRLAKAMDLLPEVASSVAEGLAAIEKRGEPSLVVTDIHLGERSGLELVRELRSRFGEELPILVVSGLNDETIAQQARDAGATDFVAKPVRRRALFARIQSLLPGS